MCAGRESNSGLVRGRDVYYHCTTGADTSVSHGHAHPTHEYGMGAGTSEAALGAQKKLCSQEAMAQWQRVGFQTQRLGVRIPLASHIFFFFFLPPVQQKKKKKDTAETGNRTQAAAATTRSPATRLFRHVEDPGIDPGSQPCEGCMLPCTTIPLRPSGLEPES